MNLKTEEWKEFLLSSICEINNGNKFDNDKMTYDNPSVNFVSRTANNNGVSGYVDLIDGVVPYPAGTLSVALGGSIGSCFLQTEPFYTGQNVCVLTFEESISDYSKLFVANIFMNECKYKFVAFGRELNKHMKTDFSLFLPIILDNNDKPVIDQNKKYSNDGYIPDWKFMEDYIKSLHHKPITTKRSNVPQIDLNIDKWESFKIEDLFSIIYKAKAHTKEEVIETDNGINFVSRTEENNGIDIVVENKNLEGIEKGNCITIGDTTATCFYQKDEFITGDHMVVLRSDWMNQSIGLFIVTELNLEKYRYSYGRAYKMDSIKSTLLKLPIQRDEQGIPIIDNEYKYHPKGFIPDWKFMEDYINTLPFSDRI